MSKWRSQKRKQKMIENLVATHVIEDLWWILKLLIVCAIITGTVLINLLVAFRIMYMTKNYKDPINAIKREPKKTDFQISYENDQKYNELNY